jgi:hypothetical protein
MRHEIAYSSFPVPSSPSFPNGYVAYRPVVRLDLVNGANRLSCYAIVDSGADACVFPLSFAVRLGLDPLAKEPSAASGVSGSTSIYHWDIEMDFGSILKIPAYVGFTSGMDAIRIGLLGQMGFFDQVNVSFDYRKKLFVIETDDFPA